MAKGSGPYRLPADMAISHFLESCPLYIYWVWEESQNEIQPLALYVPLFFFWGGWSRLMKF